jgi:SAM-dependent methyltransferase
LLRWLLLVLLKLYGHQNDWNDYKRSVKQWHNSNTLVKLRFMQTHYTNTSADPAPNEEAAHNPTEGCCTPAAVTPPTLWPWWVASLQHGLITGLSLCLEKSPTPPNRILVIGGCRQRGLAEWLAFKYPNAKIALLDTDPAQVEAAKAAIQCRFHFMHSSTEAIALPNDSVDWVIAHQVMDYAQDWAQTAHELGRVAKQLCVLSVALPGRSKLVRLMPKATQWLTQEGMGQQTPFNWNAILGAMLRHGTVKKYIEPLPWRMIAVQMHPVKEERLALV